MKALVLTYEKQVGLAQLVINSYNGIGIGKHFKFLVPANSELTVELFSDYHNVNCIQSKPDILSTMETLLKGIPDEEWVYWCIDDRFPLDINTEIFTSLVNEINDRRAEVANAVKLIYWKEEIEELRETWAGVEFRMQKPASTNGFWHHQFLRAGMLRKFFLERNPEKLNQIGDINSLHNQKEIIDFFEGIYVPNDSNIASFGEPLSQGKLTKNGLQFLKKYDCLIPAYEVLNVSMGFLNFEEQTEKYGYHKKNIKIIDGEDL